MITYMGIKMTYEDRYIIANTMLSIALAGADDRYYLEHDLSCFINDLRAAQ